MKTGPFAEHSNQLWNISAVPSWSKVNQGLIKMYRAEVCMIAVNQFISVLLSSVGHFRQEVLIGNSTSNPSVGDGFFVLLVKQKGLWSYLALACHDFIIHSVLNPMIQSKNGAIEQHL